MQLRLREGLLGVWHFASWIINHTFSAPDSDSEEQNSAQGGWPPFSGMRSHGNLSRKRRSTSSPPTLLPSQKSPKKKHKHLSLLLEEADLSSSDDSFDQGYWPNLKAPRRSLSSHTKMCLWASALLVSAAAFVQTLLWHDHHLPLLLLASVQKLPLKKKVYQFFMVFLLPGLQTIFCSICTLKYCVNCEIFFFPHKFVLQFGTYKIY